MEFQSVQAAILGKGDLASVSAVISGSNIKSVIPGQTSDYLNKQLIDTLNGLEAASQLRNMQLSQAVQSPYLQDANSNLAGVASIANQKHDNAMRQFEINEYATSNRQESIFVYQFIFFGVLAATIIGGFWRIGAVSGPLASFLTAIITAIVVFLIVYRAQYTIFKRDKRYWNKRRFQSAGPIGTLPNCPAVTDFVQNLPGNIESGLESGLQTTRGKISSALTGLGSALTSAGQATSGAGKQAQAQSDTPTSFQF